MSKPASDHLLRLIGSMTKSERRFFSVYAHRQKKGPNMKFLRLFRAMSVQKQFREALFLARNKDIPPHQLSNLKAHLYEEILKSLRLVSQEHDRDLYLSSLIDHARILFHKCLYRESRRYIALAKAEAHHGSRDSRLMEILDLEKEVSRMIIGGGSHEEALAVIRQTGEVAERIRKTNSFSGLTLAMNSYYLRAGFVKNKEDRQKVIRYFRKNLPAYHEASIGVYERLCLHQAFTGYYFFLQNFKKGYEEAKNCVELFRRYPEQKTDLPDQYILALNHLLVAQNKLNLIAEFSDTLRELISLKRSSGILMTRNRNLHLFKAIYIHEINRHYMLGEFKSGTRIVNRLQRELQKFIPLLDRHSVLLFHYKIACLYFGSSQFREALKWLYQINNAPAGQVREDLQRFARILALICHYECGHVDYIDQQVRSLYRFLLRQGTLSRYDRLLIRFLRLLPSIPNETKLRRHFESLRSELEKLKKDRFERRAFLYFDILSWLDSRIEGRPVEEIVKGKIRKLRYHNT